MPQSVPLYDDAAYLPCVAHAPVLGARFVSVAATPSPALTAGGNVRVQHSAAAGRVLGVAQFDSRATGPEANHVTVAAGPGLIVPVTAGAAIAAGASVVSGADGVAVPAAGAAGVVVHAAGVAVGDAANGAECFVRLLPHSVTV